jgi:mRNA interferase HicA
MKRLKLIRYLAESGCYLVREGGSHSVYQNLKNDRTSTVPRHTEIPDLLAEKICKDLGIPKIKQKK